MLKALKSWLVLLSSIVLLSTSAYAITSRAFLYEHENKIVEICKGFEDRVQDQRNSPFSSWLALPSRYECPITSFYGLHKVIEIITTIDKNSPDYKVLNDLLIKHYMENHDTYDFITIHLEFEKYLEEKSSKDQ